MREYIGILCVLIVASLGLSAFASLPAAAEDVPIQLGDYWNYELDDWHDWVSLVGNVKMKVVSNTAGVPDVPQDLFIVEISGNGDLTGHDYQGDLVTGIYEVSGYAFREMSSFGLYAQNLMFHNELTDQGLTLTSTNGTKTSYSPVLNDYLGDENLTSGAEFTSDSTVSISSWLNSGGTNNSYNENREISMVMEVVDTSDRVDTPAGDFDCVKIMGTLSVPGEDDQIFYYWYSDNVGNYVKMTGRYSPVIGFGNLTLNSYSYSASDESWFESLAQNDSLWVILVLVAVVVIIIVAIVFRKKGKAPSEPAPPPPQ